MKFFHEVSMKNSKIENLYQEFYTNTHMGFKFCSRIKLHLNYLIQNTSKATISYEEGYCTYYNTYTLAT